MNAIIVFAVIQTSAAFGGASLYFDSMHPQSDREVLEHVEKQVKSSKAMDSSLVVPPETQRQEEQRMLKILNHKEQK